MDKMLCILLIFLTSGCASDVKKIERRRRLEAQVFKLLNEKELTTRRKNDNKTLIILHSLGSKNLSPDQRLGDKKKSVAVEPAALAEDIDTMQSLLVEARSAGLIDPVKTTGQQSVKQSGDQQSVVNFGDYTSINTGTAGNSTVGPPLVQQADAALIGLLGKDIKMGWEIAVDKGINFAGKAMPWLVGGSILKEAFDAAGDRTAYMDSPLTDSGNQSAAIDSSQVTARVDDNHSDNSISPSSAAAEGEIE